MNDLIGNEINVEDIIVFNLPRPDWKTTKFGGALVVGVVENVRSESIRVKYFSKLEYMPIQRIKDDMCVAHLSSNQFIKIDVSEEDKNMKYDICLNHPGDGTPCSLEQFIEGEVERSSE